MSTSTVDLTKMSAAEIKAFIESQNIVPTEETVEQPRDEHGRFVAAEPEPEVAAVEPEPEAAEPVVVEKEVDLNDGSGLQVFRGVGATREEALEAVADELVKAQANATKKIQELSKPATPATPEPASTPENEFLLQQRLLDAPRATIREVLKEEFGMTPTEIKATLKAADEALENQKASQATDAFLAANPDYHTCPENGRRMLRELQAIGPATVENIQKAYESLKTDGLLVPKPAETATTVRPRSSGLSTRSSVPPPPPKAVDTSKLSLEQLRELAGGYRY